MKRWLLCALVLCIAEVMAPRSVRAGWGDGEPQCSEVGFLVSLEENTPSAYHIAGELCLPGERGVPHALQILMHGGTYNRTYWDFPYHPNHYSYVRYANMAGFATLALDMLGSGASDHPPVDQVTVPVEASIVHQIVTAVRNGALAGDHGRPLWFRHVLLVGHSLGSITAWTEADAYGDVDGLILTGVSHTTTPPDMSSGIWPAESDPRFADAGFPPGYLTSVPGVRGMAFYYADGASPKVIEVDEEIKDVVSPALLAGAMTNPGPAQNIHVPVLNITGDFDLMACPTPSCTESGGLTNEGSFYPADNCFTQVIIPDAAHSINLHYDAPFWYVRAQGWALDLIVGHHHHSAGHCPRY